MDVDTIRTLARTLTNTNSTQVSDANLLIFLNLVYHDVVKTITSRVDEDFFYQQFLANTVVGQDEYELQTATSTVPGIAKILAVGIKYKATDSEYTKVRQMDLGSLERDLAYYKENADVGDPFYLYMDDSIFIYPTVDESVANGLKVQAVILPIDLAASGAEGTILVPRNYHEVLAIGCKQYIYSLRGLINEKNDAINEYELKKNILVQELSDRSANPGEILLPNFTTLEYS